MTILWKTANAAPGNCPCRLLPVDFQQRPYMNFKTGQQRNGVQEVNAARQHMYRKALCERILQICLANLARGFSLHISQEWIHFRSLLPGTPCRLGAPGAVL